MDFGFFHDFLSIDSTSGKERKVAEWLSETLPGMFPPANRPVLRVDEVGDGTLNLLLTWGKPRIVFCSHLDTVPPYIEPTFPESVIGLLLLAGEETGSWGAKAFAKTDFRAPYLVVGEPTDNCMVSASKGTKSFDLKFTGEAFHSGYPQYGVSAVDLFVDFVNKLRAKDFGLDPVLGETTWNIGLVHSDNPQNILSPELTCRLYFRTTFVSDEAVCNWMANLGPASGRLTVTPRGGDTPATYWTVEGLPSKPVAFGSDAPHLKNFTHKAICGPGSITVAHRDDEHVLIAELEKAVEQYLVLYSTALGTE